MLSKDIVATTTLAKITKVSNVLYLIRKYNEAIRDENLDEIKKL